MRKERKFYYCIINNCHNVYHRILRVGLRESKWKYIPICFEHYWNTYKEIMPTNPETKNLKIGVEIGKLGKFIISGNLKTIPYDKRDRIIKAITVKL